MKIEMSLSSNYVSHWGWEQAFRELLQNALDCESFVIEYNQEDQTVVIFTADGAIPRQALLLGESGKKSGDTIGHFGEGLKLAMLILAREGYPITVTSGTEIWKPHMEHSDMYGCDALMIDIEEYPEGDKSCVEIVVGNISPDMAEIIDGMYLTKDHYSKALATSSQSHCFNKMDVATQAEIEALYDDHEDEDIEDLLRSKVFVGGLFVAYLNGNFKYSYNFHPSCVKLDRDRMTVNTWDVQWEISKLLATAGRADLVVALTEGKYADINGYSESHTSHYGRINSGVTRSTSYSEELKKLSRDSFISRFGEKAIPISKDEGEAKCSFLAQQCVKLGYNPVFVSSSEFMMLGGTIKLPDGLIGVEKPKTLRILKGWIQKYTDPSANKDDGVIEIMELAEQLESYEQFMGLGEVEDE